MNLFAYSNARPADSDHDEQNNVCKSFMEPSVKDVRTKSRKIDPSLATSFVRKMSALLNPPCPCKHATNFKKSEVLHQKVRTSVYEEPLSSCAKNFRIGQTPLTADVFYGPLLVLVPRLVRMEAAHLII